MLSGTEEVLYVGYNKGSFIPPSIEHDINLVCECGARYVANVVYLLDCCDGRSYCPQCGWLVEDLLDNNLAGEEE